VPRKAAGDLTARFPQGYSNHRKRIQFRTSAAKARAGGVHDNRGRNPKQVFIPARIDLHPTERLRCRYPGCFLCYRRFQTPAAQPTDLTPGIKIGHRARRDIGRAFRFKHQRKHGIGIGIGITRGAQHGTRIAGGQDKNGDIDLETYIASLGIGFRVP
jgi:hypothetical protein